MTARTTCRGGQAPEDDGNRFKRGEPLGAPPGVRPREPAMALNLRREMRHAVEAQRLRTAAMMTETEAIWARGSHLATFRPTLGLYCR